MFFAMHRPKREKAHRNPKQNEPDNGAALTLVDRDADIGKTGVAQSVCDIKIRNRINVTAGEIALAFPKMQRTKQAEESKEQVSNTRTEIQHIWSRDNERATGL